MQSPESSAGPQQRLAMIDQARRALLHGDTTPGSACLSPVIERSWRRCLAMGLRPTQPASFEAVTTEQVARLQDANRQLLDAAAPVIRSLSRAMLHTRYFAILTDAQGTVIDVNGPVDRSNPQAHAIARVGIQLSEATAGTTAIGTALADLQPVWLHRGEHFFQDNAVYSCAGAPIVGPQGQCIGMLDLTGVNVAEQPALKHLVAQSARTIENALTLALPHQIMLRVNWPGRVLGDDSDGLVGLDGDGNVTGMNRAAREILSAPASAGHCSQLFALDHAALFDAAHPAKGPIEVPLWSGLRLQMLAQAHSNRTPGHQWRGGTTHGVPLKEVEHAMIRKAVEDARGNIVEAARALGISRATLYRKLGNSRKASAQ